MQNQILSMSEAKRFIIVLALIIPFIHPVLSHGEKITIQAEDFMEGGEGIGYHDLTSENTGNCAADGAWKNEGVDIFSNAPSEGCHVGHTRQGEWTAYKHDFKESGKYKISIYAATTNTKASIILYLDDEKIGSYFLPQTSKWVDFEPYKVELDLKAGGHVFKIEQGEQSVTLDKIEIEYIDGLSSESGHSPHDHVTYFGTTDRVINVRWDEQGADYYEVVLFNVERGAVETLANGKTKKNSISFSLPYSGHFVAKIRACIETSGAPICGEWTESIDDELALVNGEKRGWWLYGHIAPAGEIDIKQQKED